MFGDAVMGKMFQRVDGRVLGNVLLVGGTRSIKIVTYNVVA